MVTNPFGGTQVATFTTGGNRARRRVTMTRLSEALAPVDQVSVDADGVELQGDLTVPPRARGVVLFAHGSGSSRHSPRNRFVAGQLRAAGLATLLVDLLTEEEGA